MGMPESAFSGVERGVDFGCGHVFNANKPGAGAGTVVEEALAEVLGLVAAVVVRFDGRAGRVGGVDVDGEAKPPRLKRANCLIPPLHLSSLPCILPDQLAIVNAQLSILDSPHSPLIIHYSQLTILYTP